MAVEKIVFVGVIVSPVSSSELSIQTSYLTVENGKITGKGTEEEFANLKKSGALSGFKEIILSESQFLVPGFVDCHLHAPQFPNIGLGLDQPLLEWLDKYTFPLESNYDNVEFARAVYDQVVITGKGTEEEFANLKKSGALSGFKEIILSESQFLVPGFVDCHLHAPQFPNIGLGLDQPLLEWLDKYTFPLESNYDNVEFARAVYDQVVERLLNNGTTTACYFASIHLEGSLELVKSVVSHRQRALVGKVSMNIKNDAGYYNDTDKELRDVETFIKKVLGYRNDLIHPVITPRFAISCDSQLMTGLSKISEKYGCRIQSHISENVKEVEHVLNTNPDCKSYAEVYDQNQILNSRCIMAHAIHLTEAEIGLLATKGVAVAHCPASNTRLKSGLCPVRKLLDNNIKLGLGTDVSGGDSASILDAVRRTMDVSTHLELQGCPGAHVDWREALCLATLGGARALNLEDRIGSFDVGKDFDALLIDVYASGGAIDRYDYSVDSSREERAVSLVQRFVYLGDDRNIRQVYVKGDKVKDLF